MSRENNKDVVNIPGCFPVVRKALWEIDDFPVNDSPLLFRSGFSFVVCKNKIKTLLSRSQTMQVLLLKGISLHDLFFWGGCHGCKSNYHDVNISLFWCKNWMLSTKTLYNLIFLYFTFIVILSQCSSSYFICLHISVLSTDCPSATSNRNSK